MKVYINIFHAIVSDIHFWNNLTLIEKEKKISTFLGNFQKTDYLVDYFEDFRVDLSKKTLNSYIKSVSKP